MLIHTSIQGRCTSGLESFKMLVNLIEIVIKASRYQIIPMRGK
jgi:hypothetical protein